MPHVAASRTHASARRRIAGEIARLALVLLALELIVRIGPVHTFLETHIGPYENLLWHDLRLATYHHRLAANPDETIWVIGSSPTQTGINPAVVQDTLRQMGYTDFTVRNYTFSALLNLEVMAGAIDRWLLEVDQPQYIVMGISELNFGANIPERMRIQNGPIERVTIYGDSIGDFVARLLYENSFLYRYGLIAKHAASIPLETAVRDPMPDGFVAMPGEHTCPDLDREAARQQTRKVNDAAVETGLRRLDHVLDAIQKRHIPLMIVSMPIARCRLESGYGTEAFYRAAYLDPVISHLRQRGIPVVELDSLYMTRIPLEEQNVYFDNGTHPNTKGADLLSVWLAEHIDNWLKSGTAQITASSGRD